MARNLKDWYKSNTIKLALLQGIAGVIVAFGTEYPELGGLVVAKSIVDFVLRLKTGKPIQFKLK